MRAIGIDLSSVIAAIEESFGPDALRSAPPVPERWRWLRGRRRRRPRRTEQPRLSQQPGPGQQCGDGRSRRHIPFLASSKKALELSLREALRLGYRTIGSEHILLGLLRERRSAGAQILVGHGLDLDDLRRRTIQALHDAAA